MMKKLFSIVLPIYGNEKNLEYTIPYINEHRSLFPDYDVEVIMVCDGSPDNSWQTMKRMKEEYPELNIRNYNFNKNYWQKIAITCGVEKAKGDVIGVISADLQDPFELFVDMLEQWENGYKFVGGARKERTDPGIGWVFSNMYHKFLNKYVNKNYPKGGCDFFVIDNSLQNSFCERITKYGSMILVLLDLVDKPYFIAYERQERKIGKSGFTSYKKMYGVITTFVLNTDRLFYWMIFFGVGAALFSVVLFIALTILKSDIFFLCIGLILLFLSTIISILGLLGISLYNWAQELRKLPKYVIDEEDV